LYSHLGFTVSYRRSYRDPSCCCHHGNYPYFAIRIIREYERAVVFCLGRLIGAKGPGLIFLIPTVDKAVKVDLRVVTLDVPKQKIITLDNVTVDVDAVVYLRVHEPTKA
jgi:regulator of protease activity HflC (stomatin/prohibitin superfamily)